MAHKGQGFDDHIINFLQYIRPVYFEKNANSKLATFLSKWCLIRDREGFAESPLVSVSTEMSASRDTTSLKRFTTFFKPTLKNVIKTTRKNGGTILVNSNYGPSYAEKFGRKSKASKVYSCNCGAYIYKVDENGNKTVLKDEQIPRTAVDAILKVLDGQNNIISLHGKDTTYRTQRFNSQNLGALYRDLGWFTPVKLRLYAIKNIRMFHLHGKHDDYGFQFTRDNAYGITISPIVHDKQTRNADNGIKKHTLVTSTAKIVSGIGEGVLFPVLKVSSYADRQKEIAAQQLMGIQETILMLDSAPDELKSKFKDSVDLLITSQGLRIVPKGCSKVNAIKECGNAVGNRDKDHVGIFGSGPEDFCMQLSLEQAAAAVRSGKAESLVAPQDVVDGDKLHITSFLPENMYGVSRSLTSVALQKMAISTNEQALSEKLAKAEQEAVNKQLPEFLKANPSATPEQIKKFQEAVKLGVKTRFKLKPEERTDAEDYASTGYRKLFNEKIKELARPSKSKSSPTP